MPANRSVLRAAFDAAAALLAFWVAIALAAGGAAAAEKPCPTLPGIQDPCRMEYKPSGWKPGKTTYWIDTDGVDPGVAGCHIEVTGPNSRTFATPRRVFGEACEAGGKILIESNPGINEIHAHENDLGHPYRVNCETWCKGQGKRTGACQPVQVRLANVACASARCTCR